MLTLRIQEGVLLDQGLADQVEAALAAVRERFPETRDIHVFPEYLPEFVWVCAAGPWIAGWRRGEVLTGHPETDQIGQTYGLEGVTRRVSVDQEACEDFRLWFSQRLKTWEVAPLYERLDFVEHARAPGTAGDGPNIFLIRKGGLFHVVFKNAWGDCPAGCTQKHYHYFEYDTVTGEVTKRGELAPGDPRPDFYLWGIPDRPRVKSYRDGDDLVHKCSAGPWWINLDALAVVDYLLDPQQTGPRYGEDREDWGHFERVRRAVLSNRRGTLLAVAAALVNEDADVRREAARVLQTRAGQDFGQGEAALAKWREWLAAEGPK